MRKSDAASALLSVAYVAHCVWHILLAAALVMAPGWIHGQSQGGLPHWLILAALLATTTVVLAFGLRRHGCFRVAAAAGVGCTALIGAAVSEPGAAAAHGATIATWLGTAGGLALAWAHWDNFRLSRRAAVAGRPPTTA